MADPEKKYRFNWNKVNPNCFKGGWGLVSGPGGLGRRIAGKAATKITSAAIANVIPYVGLAVDLGMFAWSAYDVYNELNSGDPWWIES